MPRPPSTTLPSSHLTGSSFSPMSPAPFGSTIPPLFSDCGNDMEKDYYWSLAQRFYLSLDMVMEAKQVFDKYREVEQAMASRPNSAPTRPHVSDAAEHSKPSIASTAPTTNISIASSEDHATTTQSQHRPSASIATAPPGTEELGVAGLQAFYMDLGIPKSALEIADVIQLMCSYPAELAMLKRKEAAEHELELQRQREQELLEQGLATSNQSRSSSRGGKAKKKGSTASRPVSVVEKSPDREKSSGSNPDGVGLHDAAAAYSECATAAAESTKGRGLTFPLFLFLLQKRLSDEEGTPEHKDAEVIQAFHTMDADHDGILSEEDIQRGLIYLLQEEGVLSNDRDLIELASLHPVELRTAILECDMNADGVVTVEDLLAVLRV